MCPRLHRCSSQRIALVLLFVSILSFHPTTARHGRRANREGARQRELWEQADIDCFGTCKMRVAHMTEKQLQFRNILEEGHIELVDFHVGFPEFNEPVMDMYPYMGNAYRASHWTWASEFAGKRVLELPQDADLLSLYALKASRKTVRVQMHSHPARCIILMSRECRLHKVRVALMEQVIHTENRKARRDYLCHQVLNNTEVLTSPTQTSVTRVYEFAYRCCDIAEYNIGKTRCNIYLTQNQNISIMLKFLDFIAVIVTLTSPLLLLKLKLILKFDNSVKYFRASIKHGITGKRDYAIKIVQRQLLNLHETKPFSLPWVICRIVFGCYGEGRCLIHYWGDWLHQPLICEKYSKVRRCWLTFWRIFAVIALYPIVLYVALLLYTTKLAILHNMISFADTISINGQLRLNINVIGSCLFPQSNTAKTVLMGLAYLSFLYTVILLSWPNSPFEKCLMSLTSSGQEESKEATDKLHNEIRDNYKGTMKNLTYGDFDQKRHFFRIYWCPWGIRRVLLCIKNILMQIPIINICFRLSNFDAKLFNIRERDKEDEGYEEPDEEENKSWSDCVGSCSIQLVGKFILTILIWMIFVLPLIGYCCAVFFMAEFVLNVLFFTLVASLIHPGEVLPWIVLAAVIAYYTNDCLAAMQTQHRDVLRLINMNLPSVVATEDSGNTFKQIQVSNLMSHHLGALKFVDIANGEHITKELFYKICSDLKCGIARSVRQFAMKLFILVLFAVFVFLFSRILGLYLGHRLLITALAVLLCITPKVCQLSKSQREIRNARRLRYARDVIAALDRHRRVDHRDCVDNSEEDLSTYDVRPIGGMQITLPRRCNSGSLQLYKFPMVVSADRQVTSTDSFLAAMVQKIAAAVFLNKVITQCPSYDLDSETTLRQWTLLVEESVLEGARKAEKVSDWLHRDRHAIFSRNLRIAHFQTGNTIDNVVDNTNAELLRQQTRGVLITINNVSFSICKFNGIIMVFNAQCHTKHVTDLFGSVLILTDFNTQNIQSAIKYLMDPYNPDIVPVYAIMNTEGYVVQPAAIVEIEEVGESHS